MTKDEALEMAIDYLDGSYEAHKVRKACQEALEVVDRHEQPTQEPVAYMYADEKTAHVLWKGDKPPAETIALYTHPHQWQGLTHDEIDKMLTSFPHATFKLARAVSQALKEKNTP